MVVDAMLKDSDIPRFVARRTKRTYSADTKAELMAACLVPGASIAAIASAHGMNANVLHRWLQLERQSAPGAGLRIKTAAVKTPDQPLPSFIPLPLAVQAPAPVPAVIQVEVRTGALVMTVTWPLSAASDFASWSAAVLK
jgi:hypothetical protein